MYERTVNAANAGKTLGKKNITFRAKKVAKREVNAANAGKECNVSCQKICKAYMSLNKSHLFFHFLKNAVSLLLLVISERVVSAARAQKIFAGKEQNICVKKVAKRVRVWNESSCNC